MIKSMTGYGRHKEFIDGSDITVEVKSVNSRYLDCNIKLNRVYGVLEDKLKQLAAGYITRGKIDIYVFVEYMEGDKVELSLNREYLEGYLKALQTIKQDYGIEGDINLRLLAGKTDIFLARKADEDMAAVWQNVKTVAEKAFASFLVMRENEGSKLRGDLLARLETLEALREKLLELAPASVKEYNGKMVERVKTLLDGAPVDETRLITECAVYADKCDITEELVRLNSHFEQFREMLEESLPVGRKMDFLVQEMNREINTTGSKCCDSNMAKLVIEAKSEFEKIREQIQNIE
ncbi:MAG: YicC family protein [Eubacteriales bacterium]|nr:YicC family protein [Eubacteriales bacterium]